MPEESVENGSVESPRGEASVHECCSVKDAVNIIGNGCVQYFAVVASTLCLMSYVVDVLGFGLVLPAASCDLQLTTLKKGLLSSVPYLGLTLSSHAWGFLSDSIGRRRVILLSLSSSICFSLAAALAPTYWIILAMRFISGSCLSGATSAMYPFIGELLTTEHRSKFMMFIGYAMGLGMLYSTGVSWTVQRFDLTVNVLEDYAIQRWRWHMIFAILPATLATLIYSSLLPETPAFLIHIGEDEKAMRVLHWIYRQNGNEGSKFPIKDLEKETRPEQSKKLSVVLTSFMYETKTLFRAPYLWPVLGSCLIQYAFFTVSAGYILWYPEITKRLTEYETTSGGEAVTLCRIFSESRKENATLLTIFNWDDCLVEIPMKVYKDNLVLGISYLLANSVVYFSHLKVRLRHLTLVAMILSTTGAVLLPNLTDELLIVICFTCFVTGSSIGISIFNVQLVEIFPTSLCGMVVGLTMLVGRIATFIGTNCLGVLLETTHCEAVFYGTGVLLIASISCLVLLPKSGIKGD